jgi:hypothetical protein
MAEETPCPVSLDKIHCQHWYDGEICHFCGAPAMTEAEKRDQGMLDPPEDALAKFAERKANAPEKIDNAQLPAGSPMYYYCGLCGVLVAVKPEDWWEDPPPKLCSECTELKEAGLIE